MTERILDEHDKAILSSARAAETLADELCKNTGWNLVDVMAGLLWGVARICRRLGLSREQTLKHVTTALDCMEIDAKAAEKGAPS